MAGVAIDTVEDIKRLFKDIPIENTSISMTRMELFCQLWLF